MICSVLCLVVLVSSCFLTVCVCWFSLPVLNTSPTQWAAESLYIEPNTARRRQKAEEA